MEFITVFRHYLQYMCIPFTNFHNEIPHRSNYLFFALRFFISSQNSRVVMSSFLSSQKVL